MRYIWLLVLVACSSEAITEPRKLSPPKVHPAPVIVKAGVAAWGDSFTESAYPIDLGQMTLRQVYNGGVSGETSSQILTRILADTEHRSDIQIFWMGRNNFEDADRVKEDIAEAVAHARGHFIVLPILNGAYSDEGSGSVKLATILQLNADLKATYPQNFVDIRSLLVGDGDVTPANLRSDELHLNADGYYLVALTIEQFIEARGW